MMGDIKINRDTHGCACGVPGQKIARRPLYNTREWEIDIRHEEGGVHTNLIRLHEKPVLKR